MNEAQEAQRALGLTDEDVYRAHIECMSGGEVTVRVFHASGRTFAQAVWFRRTGARRTHLNIMQYTDVTLLGALSSIEQALKRSGFIGAA